MPFVTIEAARVAKDQARSVVAGRADVTGVGIARVDGSYAVKVNMTQSQPADLPTQINGVRVIYEQTGAVRPR